MAASTITRDAWTNDTGTALQPNADGTVINNAALQNNVYARIDELMSGAGSYATLTLGGKLSVEGGQIVFPATQSAAAGANTLDDYEEGTWTPTVAADGGNSGQTYTTQQGSYLKVGQLVFAAFNIVLSNKGTLTGNVEIGGFPFAASATTPSAVCLCQWDNTATSFVQLQLEMLASSTAAFFRAMTAAATSSTGTTLVTANVNNTTTFRGTMVYRASA